MSGRGVARVTKGVAISLFLSSPLDGEGVVAPRPHHQWSNTGEPPQDAPTQTAHRTLEKPSCKHKTCLPGCCCFMVANIILRLLGSFCSFLEASCRLQLPPGGPRYTTSSHSARTTSPPLVKDGALGQRLPGYRRAVTSGLWIQHNVSSVDHQPRSRQLPTACGGPRTSVGDWGWPRLTGLEPLVECCVVSRSPVPHFAVKCNGTLVRTRLHVDPVDARFAKNTADT